jgi:hypothetical protein
MMNSMAQSMTRGSLHTPSPMLASMNLPSFHPPESQPSNATLTADPEVMAPPGASQHSISEEQLPIEASLQQEDLQTSIAQKRYIFDDQYTQLEQSYREARQPITMSESVPEPELSGIVSGVSNPVYPDPRLTRSLNASHHFSSLNVMSMSTLDASLFMSASPHMQHSQWAASSSLSQG